MKLLYDVLRYEPEDIKKAVFFVTNNALVCETPDDAMKVNLETYRISSWIFGNLIIKAGRL